MNETLNPRNTRGGQPASGREDPLAELARIVGAEDPFANLFHDARRVPENVRREEHTLQDLAGRQDPTKRDQPAYDEVEDGFTGELRGAYDDHDRPRPVRSHPSIRPTYDEGGPAPLRGALDGGFSRFDEDEDEAVEDGYDAAYADDGYGDEGEALVAAPEPKPRGSVFAKAATAIVLIVAAGGGVIAWKSNLFDTGSLPGGGKPPMIMASEEPAKVKPEIVAANDAKPSTKEIFDRPNAVKPAAPDKVLSREEQPVALSVASAEPSEPKMITRSVTPVSAGQTASAPLDPAPAGPLPPSSAAPEPMPVSSSIEPRRVRTVKVLADGTVVTGEATAPARALPADIPAGVPSLASEQAEFGNADHGDHPAYFGVGASAAGGSGDSREARIAADGDGRYPRGRRRRQRRVGRNRHFVRSRAEFTFKPRRSRRRPPCLRCDRETFPSPHRRRDRNPSTSRRSQAARQGD